jgi:hypothetical protein
VVVVVVGVVVEVVVIEVVEVDVVVVAGALVDVGAVEVVEVVVAVGVAVAVGADVVVEPAAVVAGTADRIVVLVDFAGRLVVDVAEVTANKVVGEWTRVVGETVSGGGAVGREATVVGSIDASEAIGIVDEVDRTVDGGGAPSIGIRAAEVVVFSLDCAFAE